MLQLLKDTRANRKEWEEAKEELEKICSFLSEKITNATQELDKAVRDLELVDVWLKRSGVS
jgi:exonuclease VII small subunit